MSFLGLSDTKVGGWNLVSGVYFQGVDPKSQALVRFYIEEKKKKEKN